MGNAREKPASTSNETSSWLADVSFSLRRASQLDRKSQLPTDVVKNCGGLEPIAKEQWLGDT